MILRILNLCVIVALVLAAVDVYTIKFEATRQAQRPPSCGSKSGARTTPSPACGPSGRGSTSRRASRRWRSVISP
jgi:hypothetical protein